MKALNTTFCSSGPDESTPAGLDLWYQERHNDEVSFGLHVSGTVFSGRSEFQKVDVFDTHGFGRVLTLDGLMMVTDRDEFVYHEMIAHVTLLSHPNPKRVLVIGGGDGGTLREVLRHDCVEEAVLCEIDGMVIDAARRFMPSVAVGLDHPRAKVHVADGVAFVKNAPDASFDVVLVDSTDPIGPGVGLFSTAFYKEVRRILRPNGIVAAQCESPWESGIDLARVYQNLKDGMGKVWSMTGSIPSYPYGFWSWGFASATQDPIRDLQVDRAKAIEAHTRWYNRDLHKGAFAIPNFLKQRLKGVAENG